MFRNIASFVKGAVLGVGELLAGAFTASEKPQIGLHAPGSAEEPFPQGAARTDEPEARPGDASHVTAPAPCEDKAPARADGADCRVEIAIAQQPGAGPAGRPGPPQPARRPLRKARPPAAKKPADAARRGANPAAAPRASSTSEGAAAAPFANGAELNAGAPAAADAKSRVAFRYQLLKADGLTAKEANDFSRSERKFSLYRRLASTPLFEGGKTQWEVLKEFDMKAAQQLAGRKASGAAQEELQNIKEQVAAARAELIAKYQGGDDAISLKPLALDKVAKMIGLEEF